MINSVFIPAVVIILMVLIGTGLTLKHFTLVLQSPWKLLGATLLQALVLPVGALMIIMLFEPPVAIAVGLLLTAAAPGGALSNYYCHLGRMDTAFFVVMAAVSSIITFIFMPLVLTVTLPYVMDVAAVDIVVIELIAGLIFILLLPVLLGMLLRLFSRCSVVV